MGGDSTVKTKGTLKRIIELLTHPIFAVGGTLDQATELLQFIWAADNGFMKPVNLTEATESDELEDIQSVSTANYERAESDKINGRKHGETDHKNEDAEVEDDEDDKEEKEENEEQEEEKEENAENGEDGHTPERTAQKKKDIPNPEKRDEGPGTPSLQQLGGIPRRNSWATDNNSPFLQRVSQSATPVTETPIDEEEITVLSSTSPTASDMDDASLSDSSSPPPK